MFICLVPNRNRYFGHGGAEQYLRGDYVRRLGNCPPTLLLGCSSGLLKDAGVYEPYGTALNYLVGGWFACPFSLVRVMLLQVVNNRSLVPPC